MWKHFGYSTSMYVESVRSELLYLKIPTNYFRYTGPDLSGFYKIEVWIE